MIVNHWKKLSRVCDSSNFFSLSVFVSLDSILVLLWKLYKCLNYTCIASIASRISAINNHPMLALCRCGSCCSYCWAVSAG